MTQSEELEAMAEDSEAEAWMARADELAEWASETLVNRIDVYGGH